MSKPKGKRRRTVRAELRRRQVQASKTGGMICAGCGAVVPFEEVTFLASGGSTVAYCLNCALGTDSEGYVAMLWDGAA